MIQRIDVDMDEDMDVESCSGSRGYIFPCKFQYAPLINKKWYKNVNKKLHVISTQLVAGLYCVWSGGQRVVSNPS